MLGTPFGDDGQWLRLANQQFSLKTKRLPPSSEHALFSHSNHVVSPNVLQMTLYHFEKCSGFVISSPTTSPPTQANMVSQSGESVGNLMQPAVSTM